jgi:DNA ligase (NAD+)
MVAGEKCGPSKLEKATKLGVEIISEEVFLKIVNE